MSRMVTQDIKISIVPGGVPPRISIKQWNQGLNTLRFHVYDTDGSPYIIPSDTSVSFKGRVQVSGGTNAMLMYRCTTANNLVTVVVPVQLTMETGDIYCELCFTDSKGNTTASIDIILEILPGTPTTGTVISGSDLAYANQVLNDLQSSYAQQVLQNTSPFKFKGTIAAQSNLPSSGNTVNDTYYVTGLGYSMTWNGSAWSRSSFTSGDFFNLNYSQRTAIAENTNLNSLTTPGNYYAGSADLASKLVNSPVTANAFILMVSSMYQSDRICQIAIVQVGSDEVPVYMRFGSGSDWSEWYRFGSQSDIEKRVKLPVYNPDGKVGQVLRSNGNGETEWADYNIHSYDEDTGTLTLML